NDSTAENGEGTSPRQRADRLTPSQGVPYKTNSRLIRNHCSCSSRASRYPVHNTADKLTNVSESPRVGFQALCALARWLGSRDDRVPAAAGLADAAAGKAAGARRDVGTDSSPPEHDARL